MGRGLLRELDTSLLLVSLRLLTGNNLATDSIPRVSETQRLTVRALNKTDLIFHNQNLSHISDVESQAVTA